MIAAVPENHRGGPAPGNRYPHRVQTMASLTVLCLLGVLVLGMVTAMVLRADSADADTDWVTLFTVGKGAGPLHLGGVTLGMTPADIRRLHPNLALTAAATGESLGTFVFRGVAYTVWFLGRDGGEKAFRIRADETFPTFTEAHFQARFAEIFGRPATSECTRSTVSGVDECRFRWWPADGASLDVATTQVQTPKPRTTLTTVLADTYLEGKRRRARRPRAR